MKRLLLFVMGMLAGCVSIPVSEPDAYGFKWYQEREACKTVEIREVVDVYFYCPPKSCACTIRKLKTDACTIYVPINPSKDLVDHELRHANGEAHLSHKVEKCPK